MPGLFTPKNTSLMLPERKWIAGVIILFICWCSFIGYETSYFLMTPFYIKHTINFSLLVSVALAGYYGLNDRKQELMTIVWKHLYVFIILLMLTIGLLDLIFKFHVSSFRELIHDLRMFFTGPVPYTLLLLFKLNLKDDKKYVRR
jgi:hypothetical protein